MTYLKGLYNDADGWLTVWHPADSKGSKRNKPETLWFHTSELDAAETYMQTSSLGENVYHGWELQREKLPRGRGSSATVVAVPGIMMDIDIKSNIPGVHANDNLPTC